MLAIIYRLPYIITRWLVAARHILRHLDVSFPHMPPMRTRDARYRRSRP